jgi:two-component system, chemotaxis family, chemotaxis protein CheY
VVSVVTAATGTALIIEDDPDMRALVRTVLEIETNFVMCKESVDGIEGLELWRAERHDVVVLDQRMPGMAGLEVARAILSESPDQVIVMFSAWLEPDVVSAALKMGVRAVLGKDRVADLARAINDPFERDREMPA